jgi:TolA-binding protein
LEEEKKNLEIANSSFKGDANETNRALNNNIKKVQ